MNGEHGQIFELIHKVDKEVARIIEQNDKRDEERKWIILKLDKLCEKSSARKDDCQKEWEEYFDKRFKNISLVLGVIWLIILIISNADKIIKVFG